MEPDPRAQCSSSVSYFVVFLFIKIWCPVVDLYPFLYLLKIDLDTVPYRGLFNGSAGIQILNTELTDAFFNQVGVKTFSGMLEILRIGILI